MAEKQHALLALQYEQGQHKGYLLVTAYDPVPGFDQMTPEQQQQQRDLRAQAESVGLPQVAIPSYMLRAERFHRRIAHKGKSHTVEYWASINNYGIKITAATTDPEFLRKVKETMSGAQFYCPQDDGSLTTEDGKAVEIQGAPYYGPTTPTFRVNAAIHDTPAKNIALGEIVNGIYRNRELGIRYELPEEWHAITAKNEDPPLELQALREYRFLHACSQTLLQAVAPLHGTSKSEADSTIVLRALDLDCLSMRTAASLTDKRTIDEVAATLERLGEFGKISSDELISISGRLFMMFQGTIAGSSATEALRPRLSQTIFATRYNKLLLMWSFMAASRSVLEDIPTGAIVFQDAPPIQLLLASKQRGHSAPK